MFRFVTDQPECWPALPLGSWKDTYATLHMWTQIVGKVRLGLTPLVNHWWNVPLYVAARGLTTSRIPYGERSFEIWFDFIRHQLVLETSEGILKTLPLVPRSVADFYREFGMGERCSDRQVDWCSLEPGSDVRWRVVHHRNQWAIQVSVLNSVQYSH